MKTGFSRACFILIFIIIFTITLFIFSEGFFSILPFLSFNDDPLSKVNDSILVEDKLLGWINKPNFSSKNLYGDGVSLSINSQSIRADEEYGYWPPQDKVRIICSGDSFTYGYGLSNDETWCHLLEKENEHIQTLNLGQFGYGFDQSYLRYKREQKHYKHDIHLFTFITDDINRMDNDTFFSENKPFLKPVNNSLRIMNYPLSKENKYLIRLKQKIKGLSTVKFFRTNFFQTKSTNTNVLGSEQQERVSVIIDDLIKTSNLNGSDLIFVQLPVLEDCLGKSTETDLWEAYFKKASVEKKFKFINVVEPFCLLPAKDVGSSFIDGSKVHLNYAEGHYNATGSERVEKIIFESLKKSHTF